MKNNEFTLKLEQMLYRLVVCNFTAIDGCCTRMNKGANSGLVKGDKIQ